MKYDSLKLNGRNYSKGELLLLAKGMLQRKKLREHERLMFTFIVEWLTPQETIKLKTSGSTGTPKIIKVRKEQMVESAKMTCNYFHLTKDSNLLLCLSSDFIAGKMMIVRAFVSGANLVIAEPNSTPLKGLKRDIDFAAMVPLQVENALSNIGTRRKFQSITNVIIGGAALPHSLERSIVTCTNKVYSTFAMTETLSHIALRRLNGKKKNELFELLPGIKITKDERGCLVINAPKLNDSPIITNDIVDIFNKSHFRWLGRHDNVINSGGIKIYPEKLEEKLEDIIPHNRFFISSLPDKKLGEKVILIIEDTKAGEIKEIKKEVEKVLSKYEKPREYIMVQRFEETSTGKVRRKETLNKLK
jgi:O-succinylbenzoic acid--CoA ligase